MERDFQEVRQGSPPPKNYFPHTLLPRVRTGLIESSFHLHGPVILLHHKLQLWPVSPPRVSHKGTQVSFPWQPPLQTPRNKYDSDRHKDAQAIKAQTSCSVETYPTDQTTHFDVTFRLESEAFTEMRIARFLSDEQSWC